MHRSMVAGSGCRPLARFACGLMVAGIMNGCTKEEAQGQDASAGTPAGLAQPRPVASPHAAVASPDASLKADGKPYRLEDALGIIQARVEQQKPKRKLTPEEGARAAAYMRGDIALMRGLSDLVSVMPKTAVELVRAVHERGVGRADAEGIADYLVRLRESLRMGNPGPLDENTSHVIGRRWEEIDYSGEGMTWERQKAFYGPKGVDDFRTPGHVQRFFSIETKMPYFIRLYKPKGGLPE